MPRPVAGAIAAHGAAGRSFRARREERGRAELAASLAMGLRVPTRAGTLVPAREAEAAGRGGTAGGPEIV
jgi:hypothetical protein